MALFKKPGCKHWLYQCSINGKKWSRTTGQVSKEKAQAAIPKLRKLAELHRTQPGICLRLKNAIVKEVDRIEMDVSRSEAERMSYALEAFFKFTGDVLLEKVNETMLREFLRHRSQRASRSTVNRELCAVVRMMKENGYQVAKPAVKRGRVVKHRPFTEDELRAFFSNCEAEHRVLFLTMLLTGARAAELMPSPRSVHTPLLKEEVDPEAGLIRLRTAKLKAGQDEKVRPIRVPEEFMIELVGHARRVLGPFVFEANQSLHQLFDRIIKRAGIAKVNTLGRKMTAHSFRHTFASRMAEQVGGNTFILKELMGHSKISTTEIYCHPEAPALMMRMPDLSAKAVGGVVEERWWKKAKTASCEAV